MSRQSPRRRARTFQAEEQPGREWVEDEGRAGGERNDTFLEVKPGWSG